MILIKASTHKVKHRKEKDREERVEASRRAELTLPLIAKSPRIYTEPRVNNSRPSVYREGQISESGLRKFPRSILNGDSYYG